MKGKNFLKIRIANLTAELNDDRTPEELVAARLKIDAKKISSLRIVRLATDARRYKGAGIKFNFVVEVELAGNFKIPRDSNIKIFREVESSEHAEDFFRRAKLPEKFKSSQPVVVGFGPAGMFAALTLASAGLNPIVYERGENADDRTASVKKFFSGGELDENSNVQFGEGGAGTFSDGKLMTRLNDPLIESVLKIFVEAGAPPEILYLQKPHVGTDKLREVVKNIRRKIEELGGKIFFRTQVTDFIFDSDKKISGLILNGEEKIFADTIFLGIGHSARDTYEMLNRHAVALEKKSFAVGLRIEHPQEFINRAQYGEDFLNPKLPVADYALTFKDVKRGRGAYSFCMCPGGSVVAAAFESGGVITNGMSNFARNSGTANSALVVTVTPEDFGKNFGADVLSGINFQRQMERAAFELGGKNFCAPVQSVGDFLSGRAESKNFSVTPTYPRGFKVADLSKCLPPEVVATLKDALIFFDGKIKNFAAPDIPLTGVETGTSAPCRILRDKDSRQSVNTPGLYPVGEGAGYAGGIMSSAVDGIKSAKKFIEQNFL